MCVVFAILTNTFSVGIVRELREKYRVANVYDDDDVVKIGKLWQNFLFLSYLTIIIIFVKCVGTCVWNLS